MIEKEIIDIKNRKEWCDSRINIGQVVRVGKICEGVFIGEEQPHQFSNHSHNYWNPIIIEMNKKGLPQSKVILYDDFSMHSQTKITERDPDYQRFLKLKNILALN